MKKKKNNTGRFINDDELKFRELVPREPTVDTLVNPSTGTVVTFTPAEGAFEVELRGPELPSGYASTLPPHEARDYWYSLRDEGFILPDEISSADGTRQPGV